MDGRAEILVPGATASFDIFGDGKHSLIYGATDNMGNTATPPPLNVQIDATSPTITQVVLTPQANANGWYNGNVSVHFEAIDHFSGVASITPDTLISSEGAGQTITVTAIDVAGNTATYTQTGINIDKTAPLIQTTGITNGATYNLGLVPQAAFSATDALSGVAKAAPVWQGAIRRGLDSSPTRPQQRIRRVILRP